MNTMNLLVFLRTSRDMATEYYKVQRFVPMYQWLQSTNCTTFDQTSKSYRGFFFLFAMWAILYLINTRIWVDRSCNFWNCSYGLIVVILELLIWKLDTFVMFKI